MRFHDASEFTAERPWGEHVAHPVWTARSLVVERAGSV